jgi:hypothetical protein
VRWRYSTQARRPVTVDLHRHHLGSAGRDWQRELTVARANLDEQLIWVGPDHCQQLRDPRRLEEVLTKPFSRGQFGNAGARVSRTCRAPRSS